MAAPQHIHVQLRRNDTGHSWGFTMKGGAQMQMPLFIEKIQPGGRAHKAGMQQGDLVVVICGRNVSQFTHDQAKSEILRAGNELDFTLQRGTPSGRNPLEALAHIQAGGTIQREHPAAKPTSPGAERGEVVEESLASFGGPVHKEHRQVALQMLDNQLSSDGGSTRGSTPSQRSTPRGGTPVQLNQPRSEVVPEHNCSFGGPVYKDVKPKTYQVLEDQLPPENPADSLPKPSSIFDRKRQERSDYLNASGPTIQKAFGEGVH